MTDTGKLRKTILVVSITLFLISLTQKCYCTTSNCSDSIMAFLLGWFGLLTGGAGISWLANPLVVIAWFMLKKKPNVSFYLSLVATLFALSFLLFSTVTANENGQAQKITAYRLGYWVWLLSWVITVIGALFVWKKSNGKTNII